MTHFLKKQRILVIFYQIQITVTIRREMGNDIDAACGQLRKKYIKGLKTT